jgi:hypothetical protein
MRTQLAIPPGEILFAEDIVHLREREAAEQRTAVPHVVTPTPPPGPRLPPEPAIPQGDPRAALRAGLAQRDTASAALAAARAALARGQGLLEDAEANLARLSRAQEASTAWYADELRAWATEGQGERPAAPPPPEGHAAAEAQRAAAQRARDTLARDVGAAEAATIDADRAIEGAVIAVLQADAADLAARMLAAERAAADLRESLSNLAGLWFSRRSIPLPPAIVVALRDPPQNAPAPPRTLRLSDPELRQPWQAYSARLRTNPEARFED